MFNDTIKAVKEAKENQETKPQLLTADKLKELRWMNPRQLASIYQYGKVPTHIADDSEAYKQLRWFTEGQLQAIFGKDGMNQ